MKKKEMEEAIELLQENVALLQDNLLATDHHLEALRDRVELGPTNEYIALWEKPNGS